MSSSEGRELTLELEEVLTDLGLDIRERRLDVVHENLSTPFISTSVSSQVESLLTTLSRLVR